MSEAVFGEKAPWIMALLMRDFDLDKRDAAAILGNLGHESGGLTLLQETDPVAGEGGWGWAQWTGPRRDDFEAYCERHAFDPAGDRANYNWLFVELSGPEKGALGALAGEDELFDKTVAFERAFERAGVKHYGSRHVWAKRALEAYDAAAKPVPLPDWAGGEEAPVQPGPAPSDLSAVATEDLVAEVLRREGIGGVILSGAGR